MTPKQFAKVLKRIRRDRGLTQVELSRELDVDHITVSRWERGLVLPNRFIRPTLRKRYPELAALQA